MRAQGGPDEADSPVFLTVPINDVLAAGLGALGACAALFARSRTRARPAVSITLCASSCLLQSEHLVRFPGAPPSPTAGGILPGPVRWTACTRQPTAGCGWTPWAIRISPAWSAGLAEAGKPEARGGDAEAIAARYGGRARLPVAEIVRRATTARIPAVRARQVRSWSPTSN